ncbi:MAG: prepilin peptidase [Thermoplasmata archaeon]|nr:prepilin peptidase [Thermoplasmata archaeon]
MEEIDVAKFIIGMLLLSYSSYQDLKYREADNWIWIAIALTGIFFIFFDLRKWMLILISISISVTIAFLLYLFGMGGADSKALMSLSFLNPLPPSFSIFHSPIFIFPITILINSLLLILPLPIFFFIYNLYKKNAEFPYCFFGYKMNAREAEKKFVWSMERDGKKSIMPQKEEDLKKYGNKEIWVTPKIPFLLFIATGYAVSFIFGDVLFFLVSFLQ